eukprot:jgi/Ulvmu1/6528/UM003_0161.1
MNVDDVYSDVDSEGFVEDMRHYGVGQALPLDAEGIDAEAARYLRAVREEASKIPHVCASQRRAPDQADASPSAQNEPAAPDPPKLPPPLTEWTYGVIRGFMDARGQVQHVAEFGRGRTCSEAAAPADEQRLPAASDWRAWQRSMHDPEFQPYAHTLARMDNALAATCLCALADDVARSFGGAAAAARAGPGGVTGGCEVDQGEVGALPSHLGLWLYGLMVRLELPITGDVAAALRQVVVAAEDAQRRRREGGDGGAADGGSNAGSSCGAGEAGQGGVDGAGAMDCDEGGVCAERERGGVGAGDDAVLGGDDEDGRASGVRGDDEEQAMYDTLRVVAGGFYGQDGTLACIVDDYLVRMSLR